MYAIGMENVGSALTSRRRSVFGDVALIAFLAAQACDGVLTYIGVTTFGVSAEGNPLIAWLMQSMGHGPGLAAAKITTAVFGVALHLSDVHRAVAILAGFYMVVAVGPWVALLFLWS